MTDQPKAEVAPGPKDEGERAEWLRRGNRLRSAREAAGLRGAKALADFLDTKGFSYGKLARIESGAGALSPQDADYIAKRLGLPPSFFSAPLSRLGDSHPALAHENREHRSREYKSKFGDRPPATATEAKLVRKPLRATLTELNAQVFDAVADGRREAAVELMRQRDSTIAATLIALRDLAREELVADLGYAGQGAEDELSNARSIISQSDRDLGFFRLRAALKGSGDLYTEFSMPPSEPDLEPVEARIRELRAAGLKWRAPEPQRDATARFGFSARRTLADAQKLYEEHAALADRPERLGGNEDLQSSPGPKGRVDQPYWTADDESKSDPDEIDS